MYRRKRWSFDNGELTEDAVCHESDVEEAEECPGEPEKTESRRVRRALSDGRTDSVGAHVK